ncbi:MAG: TRAP transporter TatT component family protein [Nitrospinota bacterium]
MSGRLKRWSWARGEASWGPERAAKGGALLLGALLALAGCSVKQVVVRSTTAVLQDTLAALNEEPDPELGRAAAAGQLKLLEGLIKGDPHNPELLALAARAFASYAFSFLEPEEPERAAGFYRRGFEYGLRALRQRWAFREAVGGDLKRFEESLASFEREDVEALFWTAYAWGGWANLSREDPAALADLPRIAAMMRRVLELDERHYYGGAHLFFGVYLASRPRALGGDPSRARRHFEQAIAISRGHFLTAHLLYAQHYAVQVQDRGLFESLLRRVADTPAGVLPDQRLANELARRRARALLKKADDLF